MKKIFMTLACAVIALTASAQRASSSSSSFFSTEKANQPITYGIRGGLNVASMSDDLCESKVGFNVGVAVDIPILESFYVQSGLYYTMKGYKSELDLGPYVGSSESKATIGYLEIPVLASYRYNFNDANQIQFNFGPYFAYGIHGKLKSTDNCTENYEYMGTTTETDDGWYDNDNAKHFDMGLQLGLGVTLAKHYYVGIAYEFGLLKQLKNTPSSKNRNFMVNVGYQF